MGNVIRGFAPPQVVFTRYYPFLAERTGNPFYSTNGPQKVRGTRMPLKVEMPRRWGHRAGLQPPGVAAVPLRASAVNNFSPHPC